MITKRQKEVLDFIKNYQDKNSYAPSLEEICKKLKISSVSTAHFHVEKLKELGFISKEENRPRGIDTNLGEALIEVPLVGSIAAGYPIEAIVERESIAVPKSKLPVNGTLFALRVKGDSMIDENIDDGDIVVAKSQSTAENGRRVVALIGNQEATVKKLYKEKGHIRLQPANSKYDPIIIEGDQLQVQGVVVDVVKSKKSENVYSLPQNEFREQNTVKSELKDYLNTIECIDCVEGMKKLPSNSIDLVVTSPPYDDIRNYNGFSFDLHKTGKEIFRVLKDGGIAVMVIQDQTKDFAKSLTSFRTVVDWCDNIGFRLFETVIYRKHGTEGAWWKYRFRVDHEYMPIFLKGKKPAYFDKEPLKIPSKHGGKVMTGSGNRRTDGTTTKTVTRPINLTKCRGTIWDYLMAGDKDGLKRKHPAVFPDKIPLDFIQCFCPPKGIVLDPFIGCGSTAVAAKKLNRNYLGFDISREYCDLTERRIKQVQDSLL